MSIKIDRSKCVGCGACVEVCPGNLIRPGEDRKACIKRIRDCWGCTSCVKVCPVQAISFFLGADIGGLGAVMTVSQSGTINRWKITRPDGEVNVIEVDKTASNKY